MKNGFSSFVIIGVIGMFLIGIAAYFKYQQPSHKEKPQSVQTHQITTESGNSTAEETLVLKPGQSNINLPSGALLTFGHAGTENSVPDFVFGNKYVLNDIHGINYLPIKNRLVTFHNGYLYELSKLNCNTENVFDIDVNITRVKDCTIKIKTTKTQPPQVNIADFSKKFSIVEKTQAIYGSQNKQGEALLYLGIKPIRVTKNVVGKVYIEPGTQWDVYIITNYGIETIRYTADELHQKQAKSVTTGPIEVQVKIDDITCNPPYLQSNDTCEALKDVFVFNRIDFTVSLKKLVEQTSEVKILDYQ